MYYFTVVFVIGYFFVQNVIMLYKNFTAGDPITSVTWILFGVTVLFIPVIVLMTIKAINEYKNQKKEKAEQKQDEEKIAAKKRAEMYDEALGCAVEEDIAKADEIADKIKKSNEGSSSSSPYDC